MPDCSPVLSPSFEESRLHIIPNALDALLPGSSAVAGAVNCMRRITEGRICSCFMGGAVTGTRASA